MPDLPTGFPTDEDLDEAERLCRAYAPAAEVGAYGRLIQAIARTLADERRKAYNEGAVAGMKLASTHDPYEAKADAARAEWFAERDEP